MARRERQRRRQRSKGGPARILFLTLGVTTAAVAVAVLAGVGYIVQVASSAPPITALEQTTRGENSIVYAADGTRLGIIQSDVLRQDIPSTSIPKTMKQATIAIEDRRFYEHQGVDFEGIVRAAIKNAQSGDTVQGGSTLTMQLVKNLYSLDRRRDYKRKLKEAKLAEELEELHPGRKGKEWILTKYINNVPYGTVGGQEAIGVQAASRVFFNKRAAELNPSESALLAGLPQATTDYNPYLNRTGAKRRRDEVLDAMAKAGYITRATATETKAEPVKLERTSYYKKRRESYFFDYVRAELSRKYGIERVRKGGLKVYTTVNFKRQQLARAAIEKNLDDPGSPSSAIVSIDPKNGHILTMASSGRYDDSNFNLAAQGKRQPGSTFKMMGIMDALRRGVDINRTSYVSRPLNFSDPKYGKIEVKNSDGGSKGRGSMSLFKAVVASDNTVFQQLSLDLGPDRVADTAKDMGISTKLNGFPAEILGGLTVGVSPLEMTRAYNTINSGGDRMKPIAISKVVFPDGRTSYALGRTQRKKVFSDGETREAIEALKANVRGGTGRSASLGFCPAAGKTGTTTAFVDSWFAGMTRNATTVVWVGYPNRRTRKFMNNVPGWGTMFGGKAPASIWRDYMEKAVDRKTCGDWPKPKEPFRGSPFKGRYASGGGPRSTGFTTPYQPGVAASPYESPPQADPGTAADPITPAPEAAPELIPPSEPADGVSGGAGGATGVTP